MANTRFRTKELTYMSIFTALIAVCSWMAIPSAVPFTMQTFAVFITLLLLGGKRGTMVVCTYLLLGAIGAPVFAEFTGGLGALLGSTGGYLLGFLATALIYWGMTQVLGEAKWVKIAALVLGTVACYALGTWWFVVVYTRANGAVGYVTALGWCVIPYIIPDLCKMALAFVLSVGLAKNVKL